MKLDWSYEIQLRYSGGLFRYRETLDKPFTWAKFTGLAAEANINKGNIPYEIEYWKPKIQKWAGKTINLCSVILDFTIPDIGYVNEQYSVTYLDRSPVKQWCRLLKQSVVKQQQYTGVMDIKGVNGSIMQSKNWASSVMRAAHNDYPTFDDALNSVLRGERVATAFSREYAVGLSPYSHKKISVLHQNEIVGVVDKVDDNYVIAIPKRLEYLVEDLMQFHDTACYL